MGFDPFADLELVKFFSDDGCKIVGHSKPHVFINDFDGLRFAPVFKLCDHFEVANLGKSDISYADWNFLRGAPLRIRTKMGIFDIHT
jgi:hypothetical protein